MHDTLFPLSKELKGQVLVCFVSLAYAKNCRRETKEVCERRMDV